MPVLAIALQGAAATIIALCGRYEQILGYVVSADFIAMGLTGAALFVYRRRGEAGSFRAPGHPWTTAFFVLSCWLVVAATIHRYPKDSAIGLAILALGLPVYRLWRASPDPRGTRVALSNDLSRRALSTDANGAAPAPREGPGEGLFISRDSDGTGPEESAAPADPLARPERRSSG